MTNICLIRLVKLACIHCTLIASTLIVLFYRPGNRNFLHTMFLIYHYLPQFLAKPGSIAVHFKCCHLPISSCIHDLPILYSSVDLYMPLLLGIAANGAVPYQTPTYQGLAGMDLHNLLKPHQITTFSRLRVNAASL